MPGYLLYIYCMPHHTPCALSATEASHTPSPYTPVGHRATPARTSGALKGSAHCPSEVTHLLELYYNR